jgi:outer membrane protein assembly factor BamB
MSSSGRFILWLMLGTAVSAEKLTADDWPQWRGPLRDGVWREDGIVDRFDGNALEIRWRTNIAGGYAGPAVADGRMYVTDRQKDQNTERLFCLEEKTGKPLWTYIYACRYRGVQYDAGPRCTPTVANGKVYSVGTTGHLFCLDARSGTVIWQKDYKKDFGTAIPVWGIASAPLVDGERLIVLAGGANGATVVALNKDTGKEIWRALSEKEMGYCPPVIFKAGGVRQLIVWVPEAVVSLDPESGKTHWRQPFRSHTGLTVATPVLDGEKLLVSTFYNGSLMMRMAADRPAATMMWRGKSDSEMVTDGVHCLMSTPLLKDGYLYGVDSYGALRCLNASTGERIWETYQATGHDRWWNAFLVRNGDRVFIANEQGELIIARLTPKGYEEISRAKLIEPTNQVRRRDIVWSHPAFANRCVYARNDREIVCASLAAPRDRQTGK